MTKIKLKKMPTAATMNPMSPPRPRRPLLCRVQVCAAFANFHMKPKLTEVILDQ